jgi:hypothetical protein
MPRERVTFTDDNSAIICGKHYGRIKRCWHCGAQSVKLCDGPRADNRRGTCDRPLCGQCAIHVPPDLDFCRDHEGAAQAAAVQLALKLGCR